jgi:hypothetical protein
MHLHPCWLINCQYTAAVNLRDVARYCDLRHENCRIPKNLSDSKNWTGVGRIRSAAIEAWSLSAKDEQRANRGEHETDRAKDGAEDRYEGRGLALRGEILLARAAEERLGE